VIAALSESDRTFYATVAQVVPVFMLAFVIEYRGLIWPRNWTDPAPWETVQRLATSPSPVSQNLWQRHRVRISLAVYWVLGYLSVIGAVCAELGALIALAQDNAPINLRRVITACMIVQLICLSSAIILRMVHGRWRFPALFGLDIALIATMRFVFQH
jgi:hypothetical protein